MFHVVVEVCTGVAVLAIVASLFIHFMDLIRIDISAEIHQIKFFWVRGLISRAGTSSSRVIMPLFLSARAVHSSLALI
jgi:hypothetical protein